MTGAVGGFPSCRTMLSFIHYIYFNVLFGYQFFYGSFYVRYMSNEINRSLKISLLCDLISCACSPHLTLDHVYAIVSVCIYFFCETKGKEQRMTLFH